MRGIELGFDTLSYYYVLTARQTGGIIEQLKALPGFRTERQDYWEQTYVYHSDCFAKQGVKMVVSQIKGSRWGLLVVVHPTLVLGIPDRSALYQSEKKSAYKFIIENINCLLKRVNVPCSIDDMKLYRADVTANLIFEAPAKVNEYIRVLKKSCLLPHYRLDYFQEKEHKAKDCKTANKHSHKQYCKSAAFFTYDKTAQLEMINAFPDTLIGERVLRLEVQLRRKAMRKWVGKGGMDGSNWDIIKKLGRNVKKILQWYLKRLQLTSASYVCYQDAVKAVEESGFKEKTRERMLYLLRKTSDRATLTAALEKLRERYDMSKSQCRNILKKFEQMGISPITLKNTSTFITLPQIML